MPQVTIYLDRETERLLEHLLEDKEISKSKWISQLIRQQVAAEWPLSVIEAAGTWADDFPTLEEIRSETGTDVPRESF